MTSARTTPAARWSPSAIPDRSGTVAVVTGSVGVIAVDFFVTKILIALMY